VERLVIQETDQEVLLQSSRAYQSVIYSSERRHITTYRLIFVSHINLQVLFDVFEKCLSLFISQSCRLFEHFFDVYYQPT